MRGAYALTVLVLILLASPALAREDREAKAAWNAARADLLRAMKAGDVDARRRAVEAVAKLGTPEAATLIVDSVFPGEHAGPVLDAAVSHLVRHLTAEGYEWLMERARKGRDKWHVRTLVLEVLAERSEPGPAYDVFLGVLKEDDPRIRASALHGLSRCRKPEALAAILPHLEAPEWQVRVAAIEALAELGDEKAIVPLIRLLEVETGRLRGDVADALKRLTKKDFGIDADLWGSWLKAKQDGLEEEPAKKAEDGTASKVEVPTYYGIKILSDRMVFVIDVSLSMNDPIEIDRRKLLSETRTLRPDEEDERRGPRLEDQIDWFKIKTRLDLAKAQLIFALGQLEGRHAFNVVFFSEYAEPWQERLVKATVRNRVKAAAYVEALGANAEIRGGTNAWAALETALAFGGRDPDKRYAEGIDTIFFLSDGAPSVGAYVDPDEILTQIRRLNATRKIKIHVIAIANFDIAFLRSLAHQNGGIYKSFKKEG